MWLITKVIECETGVTVQSDKFQECEESLTLGGLYNLLDVESQYTVQSVFLSTDGKNGSWIASELTHPGEHFNI